MESADNDYLFRLQAGINDIETRIAQLRRSMNESNSQPASAPKASFQHFPSPQMNNVWNTQDVFFAASPLKSSSAHTPGGFRSPSRAASQGAPTINESLGQFVEWAQHTISNLQNERLQAQTRIVELEQLSQKQQQDIVIVTERLEKALSAERQADAAVKRLEARSTQCAAERDVAARLAQRLNDDLQKLQQQIGAESARTEAKTATLNEEHAAAVAKYEAEIQALHRKLEEQQEQHKRDEEEREQQITAKVQAMTEQRLRTMESALNDITTEMHRAQDEAKELAQTNQAYHAQVAELEEQLQLSQTLYLQARQDLEDHLDRAAKLLQL